MKKQYKKIVGIIVFASIELFFFFRTDSSGYELFFMVWGFISIALILNNTFVRRENTPLIGLGGSDSTKYAYMSNALMENRLDDGKKKSRSGGLLSTDNLVYFFFLLVNVIGYIIVMPK